MGASSLTLDVNEDYLHDPFIECLNLSLRFRPNLGADFAYGSTACLFSNFAAGGDVVKDRLESARSRYANILLICLVDQEGSTGHLLAVNKLCRWHNCNLLCITSLKELAVYLHLLCLGDHGGWLRCKVDKSSTSILSSVRGISKSDALNLCSGYSTFAGICSSHASGLWHCPGIGQTKLSSLKHATQHPFVHYRSSNEMHHSV